jgi:predicted dehydrogenase
MKLGIVGLSQIVRRRLLPAIEKQSAISVSVIATTHSDKLSGLSLEGVRVVPTYQAGLEDPEIDTVYISLPPAMHFEAALVAISAGKNVIVDKPACLTHSQAVELSVAASAHGVALDESLVWQFHPAVIELAAVSRHGASSRPPQVTVEFTMPSLAASDFRYSTALGGGMINDVGSYVASVGRVLLGEAPISVYCQSTVIDDYSTDVGFNAILEFASGTLLSVVVGIGLEYRSSLRIVLSDASYELHRAFSIPADLQSLLLIRSHGIDQTRTLDPADAWSLYLDHVADKSRDNNAVRQEIVERTVILSSLRRSSEIGQRIAIPSSLGLRSRAGL